MRIAILTSARSGSTSLFHLIEEHLKPKNFTSIAEPFNYYWRIPAKLETLDYTYFENKDNVFIKTFMGDTQIPKSFMDNVDDYWDWFFKYFNKVIILDRKDKQLQSESLTYHLKKNYLNNWHRKQYYNLSNIKEEEIEETKNLLIDDSKKMHSFSNMGYPLFYFEDIFIDKNRDTIDKLFDYIELNLNEEMYQKYVISDTFKVRLDENETLVRNLI